MMKRPFAAFALSLFVGVLMAGCSNLPTSGAVQDAAQGAVCTALTGLDSAIVELSQISAEATAADVQELLGRVEQPVQAVRTASERLTDGGLNELFAAYDNLVVTINELPADATLGDAAPDVQRAVVEVQGELARASTTLNCGE